VSVERHCLASLSSHRLCIAAHAIDVGCEPADIGFDLIIDLSGIDEGTVGDRDPQFGVS
jgi:hypothetical protein